MRNVNYDTNTRRQLGLIMTQKIMIRDTIQKINDEHATKDESQCQDGLCLYLFDP